MSEKRNSMHDNRERQTEALSAYLDGALDSAEREALERHLATCDACQAELADLRRVREMLRALPAAAAPRSFTLPVTPAPARRSGAPRHPPAWTRAAQWAGGVAAAFGVGLLTLGALHPPVLTGGAAAPERNATTSYGGSSAGPSTSPSADQATSSPDSARTPFVEGANSTTGATMTVTVATPTVVATASGAPPPVSVPGTESSGPPLFPAGATLLIGGGAALVVGTASRRRKRVSEQAQ